jgi:hypothetical protein
MLARVGQSGTFRMLGEEWLFAFYDTPALLSVVRVIEYVQKRGLDMRVCRSSISNCEPRTKVHCRPAFHCSKRAHCSILQCAPGEEKTSSHPTDMMRRLEVRAVEELGGEAGKSGGRDALPWKERVPILTYD